jgi:hypothetical protein
VYNFGRLRRVTCTAILLRGTAEIAALVLSLCNQDEGWANLMEIHRADLNELRDRLVQGHRGQSMGSDMHIVSLL